MRASRTHGWAPGHAHPASDGAFRDWRRSLGLEAATPATVIVTAAGTLEPHHIPADPDTPTILATTASGAARLRRMPLADHVEVASIADGASIHVDALIELLEARGFRLVLSEGGPVVFGQLLAARVVDEVSLTLGPQMVGRSSASERLSLVEGAELASAAAPWARLHIVMRSNDHLFLRYQPSPHQRKDLS